MSQEFLPIYNCLPDDADDHDYDKSSIYGKVLMAQDFLLTCNCWPDDEDDHELSANDTRFLSYL
jgi:hypothetical protein